LKELELLHLGRNPGISDYSVLRELPHLSEIRLWENKLEDISFLSSLPGLKVLSLGGNPGIHDYSVLIELPHLTEIYLWQNELKDISFLSRLPGLKVLSLGYNPGISDYSVLRELPQLSELYLFENNLTDVSFLAGLENLKIVNLYDNPIQNPPPEIVDQGWPAILDYFRSLEKDRQVRLNEVRVLFVGDGGSGKTSLLKQLRGLPFDEDEDKTHGIDIHTLQVTAANEAGASHSPIRARCWDFGGQEIMHASHQFFLSRRALYLLVVDGRKDHKAEYWLQHIQVFGGASPVLVIINKTDVHSAFDLDRHSLQTKFPNIKGFFRTSCKTGQGVKEVLSALQTELPLTELIQTPVAASWMTVKNRLEQETLTHCYIDHRTFNDICSGAHIPDGSSRETLIHFLNELGVVLHFSHLELEEFHVLNPRWVTEAVYRIIDSTYLAENHGILPKNKLGYVVNKEKDKRSRLDQQFADRDYSPAEMNYIISLMQRFELCYTTPDDAILVPDLLEPNTPDLAAAALPDPAPLDFIVKYDFFPRNILPRLLIRLHKHIKNNLRWRTGMALADPLLHTTAVIQADENDKTISIHIMGERKRDHLAVIRSHLREINESFKQLHYEELIPLTAAAEIQPQEPMPGEPSPPVKSRRTVSYSFLLGYERRGRDTYLDGDTDREYRVDLLLDSVVSRETRERESRQAYRGFAGIGPAADERFPYPEAEEEMPARFPRPTARRDRPDQTTKELQEALAAKELENLEIRYQNETQRKQELDDRAERKARNFMLLVAGLNALIIVALGFLFFKGKLLWNNFEQWYALAGFGFLMVVNGICVALKGEGLSLERMRARRLEKVISKLYKKKNFDEAGYDRLAEELRKRREKS
jgi:hypothetical protein